MSAQASLFDYTTGRPTAQACLRESAPSRASEAAFRKFHAENPQVYRSLVALARQAKEQGVREVGIGMLWEVLRWHFFLETTDGTFKLNNNHRSRYARLIMAQEPDLVGMFETRELTSVDP